ncbi:MAG: hypothetical protein DRP01_03915 [Archaeoglobales archaeon]|nr:MAG: hypothetical protein DRP01_03915 [Archaeoglobales archaeon]
MKLAEWIKGGRLLVTIIVVGFFELLSLGFTWLCFIRDIWEGIALGLLFSSLFSLYIWIASIVLFVKGKEIGVFK